MKARNSFQVLSWKFNQWNWVPAANLLIPNGILSLGKLSGVVLGTSRMKKLVGSKIESNPRDTLLAKYYWACSSCKTHQWSKRKPKETFELPMQVTVSEYQGTAPQGRWTEWGRQRKMWPRQKRTSSHWLGFIVEAIFVLTIKTEVKK